MCGLVAVINKTSNGFTKEQCDVFDTLLFIDQLRGAHSTGTFLVDKSNQMEWVKSAENATDFRQYKLYHDHLNNAFKRGSALVGHNRHATKGEIIDANAHPFTVDDRITLVHNGTLWGDHKKLADTDVDSHAIAHVIHNNGDDVELALKEISGAYALIWHDYKNHTVNFVRNSQRPLFWIETYNSFIWSSEASMLNFVSERFTLKPLAPPQSLEVDTLCTFKLVNEKWEVTNKKLDLSKVYTSSAMDDSTWYGYPNNANSSNIKKLNNGYFLDDQHGDLDDLPFVVGEKPEEVGRLPAPPQRGATSSVAIRLQKLQEEFAIQHKGELTWAKYQNTTNFAVVSKYYAVRFKEATEVAPGQPALGNFIYGILEEDPSIMVKIHMSPMTSESTLLDLVVNERRGMVQLKTKEWNLFSKDSGAAIGLGYAVFNCAFIKELAEKEVNSNIASAIN